IAGTHELSNILQFFKKLLLLALFPAQIEQGSRISSCHHVAFHCTFPTLSRYSSISRFWSSGVMELVTRPEAMSPAMSTTWFLKEFLALMISCSADHFACSMIRSAATLP